MKKRVAGQDPAPGESVIGRVKVEVLELKGDSVLVDLPQPTITSGTRFRLPKALLD